jgi:rRNA maturation endonuclease Nob1
MIKTSNRFQTWNSFKMGAIAWTILSLVSSISFGIFAYSAPVDRRMLGWLVAEMFLILAEFGIVIVVSFSVLLRKVDRWEVAWMKKTCQECGTTVSLKEADFCPKCGANLPPPVIRLTVSEDRIKTGELRRKTSKAKPVGTCLVCDLEMNTADVLARCPHCGNLFHKSHLSRWVSTKKQCPACGERLAESEIVVVSYD